MLPDFPSLKAEVATLLFAYVHARIAEKARLLPPRRMTLHEGKRMRMTRETGEVEVDGLKRLHADIVLGHEEINNLTIDTVFRELDRIADSFAEQQMRIAIDVINDGCRAVGNEISLGGRPITPSAVLRALSVVQIDFRPDGSPILPTLVVPPSQARRMQGIDEQIRNSKYLQQRFNKIIERKWEEWRDRESSRTLAR